MKYHSKYIEKLINANPAVITITRKTTTDDGFGGKIEDSITLEPQIVRIYNQKTQREIIADKGLRTDAHLPKILAMNDADIKIGDVFVNGGRTLRVVFLFPYMDVCLLGELEVVK
jgi:hypothetical protein